MLEAIADTITLEQARAALERLEAVKSQRAAENKFASFKAYKKQMEFFAAGKTHRERLLMAANRFGKTECGAAEMSYHLTGQYPPDWPGKRFDKPVRAWARRYVRDDARRCAGQADRAAIQRVRVGPGHGPQVLHCRHRARAGHPSRDRHRERQARQRRNVGATVQVV